MYTKLHLLILVGAALAASAISPVLAQAGTASPSTQTATAIQTTASTTQTLTWSPWCCAALRQAAIWAHWRYDAARVRFQNAAWWLQQTRNALVACRGPWYYWYWGPVWFGPPGRNAWVPYWPHHCWQQVIAHRHAIWRYTATRTRMMRALDDWRWAQRRYIMCLQFHRWPWYYGLSTTQAMSPAARMSPAGATSLIAPSGSPDSK